MNDLLKGTWILVFSFCSYFVIDDGVKSSIEGSKNEDESKVHEEETHGQSDDIDENTPIEEIKGPSVVQRVKEEVEAVAGAVVDAVRPKK